MSNKHFMLDIETLSTAVNAAVLSIGAVEFDPFSGEIKNEFYHELRLDQQNNRKIDADTVQWWVREVIFDVKKADIFCHTNTNPVRNALIWLKEFLGDDEKVIWACDPDFDCAILANLYAEYQLPTPWKFYEPKSVRTVRELAKLHDIVVPAQSKSHNALEDCVRQVGEVVTFNRSLKERISQG